MRGIEVWITGAGAMTAAGCGTEPLRALLRNGGTALQPDDELGVRVGRVEAPRTRATRGLDPAARLFVAAAEEAWGGAALGSFAGAVVVEGSSLGPLPHLLESYGRRLRRLGHATAHPLDLVSFMPGAGGAAFGQSHGLSEPAWQVAAASVSGTMAIGQGAMLVASGQAEVVIAGGADAPVQREVVDAFLAAGVQVPAGAACLPFDARRSGTSLADGAGVLVLESAEHARARGARPRARVLGYGAAAESFGRAAPDPEGTALVAAANRALARAARDPGGSGAPRIAWVKAHGTGTVPGDASELSGLAHLFGPVLGDLPVTSLKSAIGHGLGASGALEAVAVVLALEEAIVPGTWGFQSADAGAPCCTLASTPRPAPPGSVLLLSESFGGRAAALVLEA